MVDSSSEDFDARLLEAVELTGATLAFDAIGGGTMASDILRAMELAQVKKATDFSRYGSPVHKQVYVYGLLNPGDRIIRADIGTAWGVGGWLMSWHLAKIGTDATDVLRNRVVSELRTTFKTDYIAEIDLTEMLQPGTIERFAASATAGKFLLRPNR
ncbi:hypothetical protein [Oryzifoliimicrobium ureilyticus]|uniref:hypothetical protein n=1 Tax=Oryzifoliimicrobium ureilyticus TaxID=3113724 RepID=UPI0030766EE5